MKQLAKGFYFCVTFKTELGEFFELVLVEDGAQVGSEQTPLVHAVNVRR